MFIKKPKYYLRYDLWVFTQTTIPFPSNYTPARRIKNRNMTIFLEPINKYWKSHFLWFIGPCTNFMNNDFFALNFYSKS